MDKIILYRYNVDILISRILHKNQSGKTIKDRGDNHIKYFSIPNNKEAKFLTP
jgi:hypothetical protein